MSIFKDEEDGELTAEEEIAPESNPAVKVIKFILKSLFWAFIIVVNGAILWRVFSSGDPKSMKTVTGNTQLKNKYEAYLADKSAEKPPFAIFCREQEIITQDDPDEEKGILGNYGYFSLSNTVLFPSAGQIQTLFRYNNSTLGHLKEDYGLAEVPDRSELWYDVTLNITYDATPENKSDDAVKTVRLKPSEIKTGWKRLYTYERLCFDGIEDWNNIISVSVDIYYREDVNYYDRPYGSMNIFSTDKTRVKYKLSRADIKAITQGAEQ